MPSNRRGFTLCLICDDKRILLGYKKRGRGVGKWLGLGGKLEPGEGVLEAAVREAQEEAKITPRNLDKVAMLEFHNQAEVGAIIVHVFMASDYLGEPQETEEIRPEWFNRLEIPYDKMWPSDKIWLPLLLDGEKIKANFFYGQNEKMLNYDIKEP